jgi:hypothetical protein
MNSYMNLYNYIQFNIYEFVYTNSYIQNCILKKELHITLMCVNLQYTN